jgi:hypothetical protein
MDNITRFLQGARQVNVYINYAGEKRKRRIRSSNKIKKNE